LEFLLSGSEPQGRRSHATKIWPARLTPLPSCGWSSTPRARKKSNLSALRPWSSARSEPSTSPPLAWMIKASGVMPLPPTLQKK